MRRLRILFQCSSASRKFLKSVHTALSLRFCQFQCSSASRKFLKPSRLWSSGSSAEFQCSSASRKFLKRSSVSLLFSLVSGFSALQRAENSSNNTEARQVPNAPGFSALQRAENSSNRIESNPPRSYNVSVLFSEPKIPQNRHSSALCAAPRACFSALQRAENSSNRIAVAGKHARPRFQCSSASRKFLKRRLYCTVGERGGVSVLFSEPKIPQSTSRPARGEQRATFQCSSASRKFLKEGCHDDGVIALARFSALQRAENSSNLCCRTHRRRRRAVSVLFSEPKIPQTHFARDRRGGTGKFQCSSASRKFLKVRRK